MMEQLTTENGKRVGSLVLPVSSSFSLTQSRQNVFFPAVIKAKILREVKGQHHLEYLNVL